MREKGARLAELRFFDVGADFSEVEEMKISECFGKETHRIQIGMTIQEHADSREMRKKRVKEECDCFARKESEVSRRG